MPVQTIVGGVTELRGGGRKTTAAMIINLAQPIH
jgi:hypothetical protein